MLKKNQKGFTIIEVLIVLAIAGLIMIIVFLAIPALQRNSRNTQRKNDVANIGSAINEYISNNQGSLPTTNALFFSGVAPNFKVGFYDATEANAKIVYTYNATAPGSAPAGPAANVVDTVQIHTYVRCNGNAATITNATRRSIVALYRVETGTADTLLCQEL